MCPTIGEILDPRTQHTIRSNRSVAAASDFIQSNKFVAQILAMVCEDRGVRALLGEASSGKNIASQQLRVTVNCSASCSARTASRSRCGRRRSTPRPTRSSRSSSCSSARRRVLGSRPSSLVPLTSCSSARRRVLGSRRLSFLSRAAAPRAGVLSVPSSLVPLTSCSSARRCVVGRSLSLFSQQQRMDGVVARTHT